MKIVAKNKKARHDYHILDTFEAGLVLKGSEVKSIRQGKANLKESYIKNIKSELWITGMHITPYEQGSIFNPDPLRDRKLLMHSREIERLRKSTDEKGLTIVPLMLYMKNGRVKVEIALAKGKHIYDKRQDNAARDARREMDRARKTNAW